MSHIRAALRCVPVFCGAVALSAPAFGALTEAPLTNTSQVLVPTSSELRAAVNFRYPGSQPGAAGPVNGLTFEDIDPLAGPQGLVTGVTVDVSGAGGTDDRSRAQNTAATISGTDDANLESIANTINFVGYNEVSVIEFVGLEANELVRVQIIGGDAGSGINNWLGDFTITANGATVGTWNAGDDNDTTASIVTFDTAADASQTLRIELAVNNPPQPGSNGSFAGYGAIVVAAVPEPGAIGAMAIGASMLMRRRRR